MKVSRKTMLLLVDEFEAALDRCKTLDKVPFCTKREAAEIAARSASEYLAQGKKALVSTLLHELSLTELDDLGVRLEN